MDTKTRILIVDDDENICELIALNLEKEGYRTRAVHNGSEVLDAIASFAPSMVILDIMLPGKDGMQLCREIRQTSDIPIIMLTAKGETFDKILGLELGADDYMVKPFDNKELTARVKAVLRRLAPKRQNAREVKLPGLTINMDNYTVDYNGSRIDMPPKELELLYYLATHANMVFTREQLLDKIWGYEYIGDTRTVDVHVKRIREKIHGNEAWSVKTVWGIGYKLEVV